MSSSGLSFNLPGYLSWIGFNEEVPFTSDFYPLFPWITFYFLGMFLCKPFRNFLGKREKVGNPNPTNDNIPLRILQFLGKNSLAIYILHQPIFFSLLFV